MTSASFKKGQAALEFLTTYAWAFVVILIVIGALTYFGVTDPSGALPDRCNFGAEFNCVNHQLDTSANTFKLRLRNNAGGAVSASNFRVSSEEGLSCTSNPSTISAWVVGNLTDLTWSSCNPSAVGLVSGQKAKVFVEFDYYDLKSGSGYARKIKGEVYTTSR